MADLASQLVASGLESSKNAGNEVASGVKIGAELANQVELANQARQKIETAKQQAELAKWEKVGSWFDTAAKMPDGAAKKAFTSKFIPQGLSALGMGDKIDPIAQEMLLGDPNLAKYLGNEIREGRMDFSDLLDPSKIASIAHKAKQFGDVEKFKATVSDNLDPLEKAAMKRQEGEGKSERASIVAGQRGVKDKREDADGIRKELTSHPVTKETNDISSAFSRIENAFKGKPSAAGDLSGIFAYMKMLDPGSTVREGEFANAQNAGGLDDQLRNQYNKLINGERLNPDQRKDFLSQALKIKARQDKLQAKINKQFTDMGKARGHKPSEILAGVEPPEAPEKPKGFKDLPPGVQKIVIKKFADQNKMSEDEAKKKLEAQ